jgi:hypothetical protein
MRGGAPAPPPAPGLDETASFVLDDLEFPPGQIESPSQISQRTVSVTSETEDTLSGVPAVRRQAAPRPIAPPAVAPTSARRPKIALGVIAVALVALAAAWWFGLLR